MSENTGDSSARPTFVRPHVANADEDSQPTETVPRRDLRGDAPLEPGSQLGRYVVIDTLGKGGMGVVYKAVDPELGRWVAIKLVRVRRSSGRKRESTEDARARLLREAQALAKLTHPNVVTVHDVGRFQEDVFIAMEFVEGTTLRQWLKREAHSIADICRVMTAAGAGLAAAHRAGLVHRDFKPANVMIGDDGRVLVLDFGLVRTTMGPSVRPTPLPLSESSGERDPSSESSDGLLDQTATDALTRQGALVGTPAYMAPEQYTGAGVDARTDIFSFCIVLYEALYRKRPFRGKRVARLRRDITAGMFSDPPDDVHVPAHLTAVWKRGLEVEPGDRYPSMEELLADLSRDPYRRWRRLLMGLGVLALMALAALATSVLRAPESPENLCAGATDDMVEVWDDQVRSAMEQAFLATGRSHAQATFARAAERLERYRDDWVSMHTRACQATRVTGEQSESLLDLRMRCLGRHRSRLHAVTRLFVERADPGVVDNAVRAVATLPSLDRCADVDALTSQTPPPDDPEARARVDEVRARLDRPQAIEATGDYERGLAEARAIDVDAERTAYWPIRAVALMELGIIQFHAGDVRGAEDVLRRAAHAASVATDDRLFARLHIFLLGVVGDSQAREREATTLQWTAENAVARAGAPADLTAALRAKLGDVYWRQGKYAQARSLHEQALQVYREQLIGADSLLVANSYWSLGRIYWAEGQYQPARDYIQQALEIHERELGPEHPDVGKLWGNIGTILAQQYQYAEARPYLERALVIAERALGEDHPDVAGLLNNVADALGEEGQYQRAREHFQRALTVFEKIHGPEHPNVGICHQNLGEMSRKQGHHQEALPLYARALTIFEGALGNDHPFVAFPLTGIGETHLALGDARAAREALERALALRTRHQGPASDRARTEFALAQALVLARTPALRARARALASEARARFVEAGPGFTEQVAEIDSWEPGQTPR